MPLLDDNFLRTPSITTLPLHHLFGKNIISFLSSPNKNTATCESVTSDFLSVVHLFCIICRPVYRNVVYPVRTKNNDCGFCCHEKKKNLRRENFFPLSSLLFALRNFYVMYKGSVCATFPIIFFNISFNTMVSHGQQMPTKLTSLQDVWLEYLSFLFWRIVALKAQLLN